VEEEPKLINVNNEACEILGYESKDRLYRNLEEEISGTDTVFGFTKLRSIVKNLNISGKRLEFEEEIPCSDGGVKWLRGNADIAVGWDGEKIYHVFL
jgi:PAS domain-containing protein